MSIINMTLMTSMVNASTRKSTSGASRTRTPDTSRTKSPAPYYYLYDGEGEGAGVLPSGVKYYPASKGSKGTPARFESWEVFDNGRILAMVSKEDAYTVAGAKMVPCPLDGRQVPMGDVNRLCSVRLEVVSRPSLSTQTATPSTVVISTTDSRDSLFPARESSTRLFVVVLPVLSTPKSAAETGLIATARMAPVVTTTRTRIGVDMRSLRLSAAVPLTVVPTTVVVG